jgi:hypothetical protein
VQLHQELGRQLPEGNYSPDLPLNRLACWRKTPDSTNNPWSQLVLKLALVRVTTRIVLRGKKL